jgi:hypothetical protein
MKKKEDEVRSIFIKVRMNAKEVNQLKNKQQKTTERSLSEYIRNISMQKPVIVKYRNQSADDFLKQMLELKKELNAIGNNFNQAVHKLHLVDKIPEFRAWIEKYDGLQKLLIGKVEAIRLQMILIYEQWLQK